MTKLNSDEPVRAADVPCSGIPSEDDFRTCTTASQHTDNWPVCGQHSGQQPSRMKRRPLSADLPPGIVVAEQAAEQNDAGSVIASAPSAAAQSKPVTNSERHLVSAKAISGLDRGVRYWPADRRHEILLKHNNHKQPPCRSPKNLDSPNGFDSRMPATYAVMSRFCRYIFALRRKTLTPINRSRLGA